MFQYYDIGAQLYSLHNLLELTGLTESQVKNAIQAKDLVTTRGKPAFVAAGAAYSIIDLCQFQLLKELRNINLPSYICRFAGVVLTTRLMDKRAEWHGAGITCEDLAVCVFRDRDGHFGLEIIADGKARDDLPVAVSHISLDGIISTIEKKIRLLDRARPIPSFAPAGVIICDLEAQLAALADYPAADTEDSTLETIAAMPQGERPNP
jgi:hypothetical protein